MLKQLSIRIQSAVDVHYMLIEGFVHSSAAFRYVWWHRKMCNLKVVVAHIYPRVTGQRQTLNIGLSALFLLQ